MGKKVKEYKSGDFIFAKVKGYPAWPARVQKLNGKKYFVYFYGTGETANLPPNMIFDYAENKDKFLTKTVKRRDFNDGVKQIEHDFANNVPLEEVIGVPLELPAESAANDDTANDSAANDTLDETAADTTAADETLADDSAVNTTYDAGVEDSDDVGTLVIDEGKQKGRKSKVEPKAKETPAKPVKEPKTPRGKAKKEEPAKEDEDEAKKEDEIVSRSGRKIRPKRYIDEQTEDNATLPSPAPKKRRGASPPANDKEKEKPNETKDKPSDKNIKHFNAVSQSELEDLKEPFKPEDAEKENILITYLPAGQYVGIKLFQTRPISFKNEAARLQWDKQAASNAITLKMQLEKGQITSQSVVAQLVTDLNLTDEEKATLDKERETEEKKSRVQFLKTEMKLIELDAKIKTCLCLEKADTDICLKLLDELMELEVKPLMLLKHPTCLETVKRMRAYVGNTPSWELSESAALVFSRQAHKIRKQADAMYKNLKELFTTPEGLSFWEFFTERVLQFKKVTSKLSADELLEMIHEPIEMSTPTSHTMKSAVEAANEDEHKTEEPAEETTQKKKATSAKSKKTANSTPSKQPLKRQSSRKQQQEEKEKEQKVDTEKDKEETPKAAEEQENAKEAEPSKPENNITEPTQEATTEQTLENSEEAEKEVISNSEEKKEDKQKEKKEDKEKEKKEEKAKKDDKQKEKREDKQKEKKEDKQKEKNEDKHKEKKEDKEKEKNEDKEIEKKDSKVENETQNEKVVEKAQENDKEEIIKQDGEPRAKRSRESKKTEPPPPRSPAKRKSKV